MSDVAAALEAERLGLHTFLQSLPASTWSAPSHCAGWTVHDVLAHLTLSTRSSGRAFAAGMIRHHGDFDAMNAQQAVARAGEYAPEELLEQLHADIDSTKKSFGSTRADGLTDVVVHGQDIARALDLHHEVPVQHVVLALDHVVGSRWYPAKQALQHATCTATDAPWTHGDGGETIEGTVIDLLLAGTGRTQALDHLTGSGVDALRQHLDR